MVSGIRRLRTGGSPRLREIKYNYWIYVNIIFNNAKAAPR